MNTIKVDFSELHRVIHVADIHIRLLKRHDEYKCVFDTFFKKLEHSNRDNTVIVVAGDVVHSKTDLSPEMIELTTYFLSTCAELAPTLIIAGNHDMNLANKNRLDALSPICDNINNPNLHYLKNSGVYYVADTDFAVMSLLGDESDWPTASDCNSMNKIALFHGPVLSATTDVGYVVENKHYKCEMFDGFDIVMLGDIHRHQILQSTNPTIAYCSSLIQQNHGELFDGHGWIEWNVRDRTFKFNELKNKYAYYTIRVENGVIPDYSDIPSNVRLRIFAGGMEESAIKKLVTEIRKVTTIEELAITNFSGGRLTKENLNVNAFLDLHDVNYQNKLISEYIHITTPDIKQSVIDEVLELNKKLTDKITADDLPRNIIWKPISLKFDNLFTYGEGNSIIFDRLKGVAGIFAPNASGKTSVAEAICFALYDRTPRTIRASSIMNRRKAECYLEFRFEVDGKEYVIERVGKKNKKGEVKIDVDFYRLDDGVKISLNGEERRYTNAEIRKLVGDYEDFILTTFSSSAQTGLFVDKGQSDRKDLLSQFMGLNIFDKLHTIANDESKEVSAALKLFKNDDFTQTLVNIETSLSEINVEVDTLQNDLDISTKTLHKLSGQIQDEYAKVTPIPSMRNKVTLESLKETALNEIGPTMKRRLATRELEEELRTKLGKAQQKIEELKNIPVEYESYMETKRIIENLLKDVRISQASMLKDDQQLEILHKHEYDPSCEFCLKNGKTTIDNVELLSRRKLQLENFIDELNTKLNLLSQNIENRAGIEEQYLQYQNGVKWISDNLRTLQDHTNTVNSLDKKIEALRMNVILIDKDISEFNRLEDAILDNKLIKSEIEKFELLQFDEKKKTQSLTNLIQKHKTDVALLTRERQSILTRIEEAKICELKYEVYENYMNAICRDGLPYKLIAEILPELEGAVNNILTQMVDFSLRFEMDGKNVNMLLSYDEERTWPLELASGMEKFVSSLAIRVALTSLSSLPKSNFLIIDEGLGALDGENLGSIFGLFDVLRTQFDTIFLITHIEAVKDVADTLIEIERNDGYSKIKV